MRVVSISILCKTALLVLGWSAGIVLVMIAAELALVLMGVEELGSNIYHGGP